MIVNRKISSLLASASFLGQSILLKGGKSTDE